MITVYCWCGHLELGWLGSLGYILFQLNWSLKQTSEISQECVIDARMLKCTFPISSPPQDGSTSVGGGEGDWGAGEQNVTERLRGVSFVSFRLLTEHPSVFLLSLSYRLTSSHPSSFGSAKIVPALLLPPPPACPKPPLCPLTAQGCQPLGSWQSQQKRARLKAASAQKSRLPPCLRARRHTCKSSHFSLCLFSHKPRGIWSSRKKHSLYVLIK